MDNHYTTEATCTKCGAVYLVGAEMPNVIECLCENTEFRFDKQTLQK